jgi:hypothetical protein
MQLEIEELDQERFDHNKMLERKYLKSKLKIIHLGVFIFSLGGFYQRPFKIVRGCYGDNLEVLNTSS